MTNEHEFDREGIYHVMVKGSLDEKWSAWFAGFTITPQANEETLLIGSVANQAALHDLLGKIRDIGLPLLSIKRIKAGEGGAPSSLDLDI